MESSLYLPSGNQVSIRFEASQKDQSACWFLKEPSEGDLQALELAAQVLFRHVFRYSQVPKPPGSLAQPAPVWLRERVGTQQQPRLQLVS